MNKKVIIIGAGGHGKVIADIITASQDTVIGFLDDGLEKGSFVSGYPVLGPSSECVRFPDCAFVIAIGSNQIRKVLAEKYCLKWHTAIHPSAVVGSDIHLGEGTVVMANAVINASADIGKHCIINTGAVIEHDNVIEDYVHVSPHATLCGTVHVGKLTHIGAGAVIRNNRHVAANCTIGAGGVVVKDINESGTYVGVPVRRIGS